MIVEQDRKDFIRLKLQEFKRKQNLDMRMGITHIKKHEINNGNSDHVLKEQ